MPTRNGGNWTATHLRRILTGRAVLGEFSFGGEWHGGEHEALVSEEDWNAAQTVAEQGHKFAPNGRSGRLPTRHIFTRGVLRCGECGEAMFPRSEGDHYVCRTRKFLDPEACSMPPQDRAAVDSTFLEMFEQTAVDLEGTLKQVAAQMETRLAEVEAQADRAEREVSDLRTQAARVNRDYRAGTLTAANFERLSTDIADELEAAEAESQRLREHADTVRETAGEIDGEAEPSGRSPTFDPSSQSRSRAIR